MDFITGLHGSLATVLICALLFIDEAGVPLPFAPNEVLLVIAGLLIASGSLPWFIIYPLAVIAILLGCLTGFSWARAVGPDQLRTIASRLQALRAYDRARARMSHADVRAVAVARCLPGIRVYATLIAGASEMPRKTFMRAAIPAAIVWTAVLLTAGTAVGVPAVAFFGQIEKLAISGGILVLLGIVAYRAARRAPRRWPSGEVFSGIAPWHRVVLAIALDASVVAVVAAGFDRITRSFLQFRIHSILFTQELDSLLILTAVAISYLVGSRRQRRGETAGERLFAVSYVRPRRLSPEGSPKSRSTGAEPSPK